MIEINASPSKSASHRGFILAAMTGRSVLVERPLIAEDTRATLAGLRQLGYDWVAQGDDILFNRGRAVPNGPITIDCQNSGTTLRLLTALSASYAVPVTLTGDESLRQRPNEPLLDALRRAGVDVRSEAGCCPMTIQGPATPGTWSVSGEQSSQFVSGLMLLAACRPATTIKVNPPMVSTPYIRLTYDMLLAFGLDCVLEEDDLGGMQLTVNGHCAPAPVRFRIEGDWSSAAFPLVAAALAKRSIRLTGLKPDSAQADARIVAFLRRFGQHVVFEDNELVLEPRPIRSPGQLNLGACPDLFPALVVLASAADSQVTMRGCPQLAWKESNRIQAMADGLRAAQIGCTAYDDGLMVKPGPPSAGHIKAQNDHRIKMAFEVLSVSYGGRLTVDSQGAAQVSYPRFWSDLRKIR
ncbi:MAG: 3-phosphoshikimate 1-carboxyvinyltransferase [Myxococcota bacterium]|nr:3-phosphoshikimate 1-carboxyvinyltransferase [Myxococcota bacterium]